MTDDGPTEAELLEAISLLDEESTLHAVSMLNEQTKFRGRILPNSLDTESLAKLLHEAGREAVAQGAVVNRIPGQGFIEWDDLPAHAQEGRRLQARYLLERLLVIPKL